MRYDDTGVALRYDAGRRLPEATIRLWLDALGRWAGSARIQSIVDVACGTGRFSAALADLFSARVLGIDVAESMLRRARTTTSHPRVGFVRADAEELPVRDGSVDLVFMSMVYHHLPDPAAAAKEIARALRPGGTLFIRNSSLELLSEVPYLHYFPAALEINQRRLPSQHDVIDAGSSAGLTFRCHELVYQRFADSFAEYYNKISERALSDLVAITDAEFQAGLRAMEAELAGDSDPVIEPVDMFVFSKTDPTSCILAQPHRPPNGSRH